MRLLIDQPKRLTMQTRSPAAWMAFWGAIHDAALDQAHQQVRIHSGVCQGLQVIATVERHDRTWCIRALGGAYRGNLVKRDLRGRLRCRSAPLHVQRQDPTASHIRRSDQPLIGPGWDHSVLWPARQWAVLPGAVGARACGGPRPVGAIDHPQRTALDHGRVHQRPGKQGTHLGHVNRAIRECVARARPQPPECGSQAESHQRAPVGSRQGCI